MPSHPSGTVTFLFTDIEGSTRHWEQQPQAMSNALLRHDAIMRNAIEANGGYIFKTIGDAFCAAFPTAPQALQAALDAQRALAAEQWPEMTGPVQARMALHTGSAEERGGDYFGPPVNRVARLLSAGHGGQTLLSEISSGLVRDVLSPGVTLRDMGEHRLKDLAQTEQIFQVLGPGLPSEFAPLKTLDNHPNNLPLQLTPFIGREKEVETVTERLLRPEVRLLTLTGPGGTGKTRLALQAAAELAEEFEQGVFFVDLAPITDPGLVGSEIAQALGVQEAPGRPISDTLKEHLRDRRMLLVLDNFEQVVQAAALVPQLMQAAPDIKFVATSRIRLQVRGEHEYSVSPLALPRRKPPPTIEQWTQYDAVCLFIERALALTPDFAITNSNAPAVAEICHRLDGLPLAIELAAARIKILTPQVMLTRLESRLKVLTGGQRDVPARQQTLRGAIDWSYDLLDEGEKQLFRRLAIFQGGRTLEAIEAICNAEGDLEIDVLDGVQSLVDKSLLRQEEGVGGEPRFVMLETIHEYARGKLEGGEAEAMQRAHAAYYLQLAEETAPLLSRPEATTWFNRLDEEHDNIRAALRWSLDNGEIEMALNLCGALWEFWWLHGHHTEGYNWTQEALAKGAQASPQARARALNTAGVQAYFKARHEEAKASFEDSLALFRQVNDKRWTAELLNNLAVTLSEGRGDFDSARANHEESLSLRRELGDKGLIAQSLSNIGEIARAHGDYRTAAAYYEESLSLAREAGFKSQLISTLQNMGFVLLHYGNWDKAKASFTEGLSLSLEIGTKLHTAVALIGLAGVDGQRARPARAARLFGAADALLEAIGTILERPDRADHEYNLEVVRSQLDEERWQKAWEEGRAMSEEQAIGYALEEADRTNDA